MKCKLIYIRCGYGFEDYILVTDHGIFEIDLDIDYYEINDVKEVSIKAVPEVENCEKINTNKQFYGLKAELEKLLGFQLPDEIIVCDSKDFEDYL